MKKLLLIFLFPIILQAQLINLFSDSPRTVVTYADTAQIFYVDATLGNDSNDGLTELTAWETISKVNSSSFDPADQVLFKRGETWREQLTVPSSGVSGYPIVFGAYGSGDKPIIDGADTVGGNVESVITESWTATDQTGDVSETGWGVTNRNFRVIIKATNLSTSGNYVRIRFKASTGNVNIVNAGIGEQSSGADAVSMTQLTFNSGQTGVSGVTSVYTDWIPLSIDETKNYIVAFVMGGTTYNVSEYLGSSTNEYTKASGTDETQDATVSGYSAMNHVHGVFTLDVKTITGSWDLIAPGTVVAEMITNAEFESNITGVTKTDADGGTLVSAISHETVDPLYDSGSLTLAVTTGGTSDSRPIVYFASSELASGAEYIVQFHYRVNSGSPILKGMYDGNSVQAINETFSGTGIWADTILYGGTISSFMSYWDGRNTWSITIDSMSIVPNLTVDESKIWYASSPSGGTEHGFGHYYATILDDSLCSEVSALSGLTADYKVFYDRTNKDDNGEVYIYSDSDPDTRLVEMSARNFGIHVDGKSYITIKNFEIKNAGIDGVLFYGANGSSVYGGSLIDSCYFIHNRQSGARFYSGYTNSTISNSTAVRNGNGFYAASYQVDGSDHITFSNVTVLASVDFSDYHLNTDGHGIGIYGSDSCIVENSTISGNHHNIAFDPGTENPDSNNGVIIRYNTLYDASSGTAGVLAGQQTNRDVEIYYNLMYNNGSSIDEEGACGFYYSGSGNNARTYFYNNTVVNYDSTSSVGIRMSSGASDSLYVKNNIFFTVMEGLHPTIDIGGTVTPVFDYNVYYKADAPLDTWRRNGTFIDVFSTWQSAISGDANSVVDNPDFTDSSAVWTLQAGSPAINNGATLSIPAVDILGNPLNGQRDIGAYEKQ